MPPLQSGLENEQDAATGFPAAASLRPFFEPRTVAVVGASRRRGRIGAEIFHNLAAGGFRGRIVPVNTQASEVAGVTAYATVEQIPGSVDLAVIAVPAHCVDASVDDCLAKGVPAIVVISAGFGETGDEGRARETALRERVRAAGARMVGPNCMGILNTDPAVRLNATFSPVFPPAGGVAFASQSGALGLAILAAAERLHLGISSFASLGNKADVSTNDLLELWAADPRTTVILLYVESFGNPRRFSRIARRVGRVTPIVALKAGRSRAGARAATSHTGALAARDAVVDALFRESGVIRTDTLAELFDVAALMAKQPVPAGPRVAILTNAGGPGILAADACEALGLELPALSPQTLEGLLAFLPAAAGFSNPIDMLATASADDYGRAVRLIAEDPGIDSLLTIFIPPLVTDPIEAARTVAIAARQISKPVMAAFFGVEGVDEALAPVPCYTFPESAARALARAVEYGRWRAKPAGSIPEFPDLDEEAARTIVAHAGTSGDGWLAPLDAFALLDACHIPRIPTLPVASEADALATAHRLGLPVVLKGVGPSLLHKTEAHAVRIHLNHERSLRAAYRELAARQDGDVQQILMQPMVRGGVECLVGAVLDPTFGHVMVCGSGGTMVELLRDTVTRLHPITDLAAREMVDGMRGVALLRGYRGAPLADEAALRDVLLRVSALLDACPEIVELDLNPVVVGGDGARAVDVRVRVERTGSPVAITVLEGGSHDNRHTHPARSASS